MSDSSDGSSSAAQSAQPTEADEPRPGFWERVFGRTPDPESSNAEAVARVAAVAGTQTLLSNVRKMHDQRVEDIAIPIADIVAVPDTASLKDIVATFRESTYSRLPVYSETLDNPIGLVHMKDVALEHGFGSKKPFDLKTILRPLIYAPPSMPLRALLQKMQNDRIHMALVIDEHGGVDGLVTIEDLIEEIVGEIADEHDAEEDQLWIQESPGVFLAQARAPLQEFEQVAGIDLLPDDLDEDVDTLGGLVFMLSGRVPARGECLKDSAGHEFEVVDADARSIKRLRVRLNGTAQEAAE